MNNLILFVNAWLSYFLVFIIFIAVMIIGGVLGVKWRKSKDAKAAVNETTGMTDEKV